MRCTTIQRKPTGTRGYNGRNNMSTYKVSLRWDFIVEADTDWQAKMAVAELTAQPFTKVARDDMFAYEDMSAQLIDNLGAGVHAGL